MANITEILGTDSLSASRLTLNSNFTALNDEIADITALLDPVTSTLSGIDSISAQQLTLSASVNNVQTQLFQVDSSALVANVASAFNGSVNLQRVVQKSGKLGAAGSGNGSTSTTPDFSTISTFFANQSTVSLPTGVDGQEVVIISTNATGVTIQSGTGTLSATTLVLDGLNSSVTLKYFSSTNTWYIINSHDITWS
jgi:hypothetical protein